MWFDPNYCEDCGRFFEEPDSYEYDPSPMGIGLSPGSCKVYICPYCDSEYITEREEN